MNKLYYYVLPVVLGGVVPSAMAEDSGTSALESAVNAGFTQLERDMIGKYYQEHQTSGTYSQEHQTSGTYSDEDRTRKTRHRKSKRGLPPGLAKRNKLPPGLERQLQKNGTLPPGLAKRNLPAALERELPPPPRGYERQIVEDATVVLVNKATGKIADIIYNAVSGK